MNPNYVGLKSGALAERIMADYPRDGENWGEGLVLASKLPFKPVHRSMLGEYYLNRPVNVKRFPVRLVVECMGVDNFIEAVKASTVLPEDRIDLLVYYSLIALYKIAENDEQQAKIRDFETHMEAKYNLRP